VHRSKPSVRCALVGHAGVQAGSVSSTPILERKRRAATGIGNPAVAIGKLRAAAASSGASFERRLPGSCVDTGKRRGAIAGAGAIAGLSWWRGGLRVAGLVRMP